MEGHILGKLPLKDLVRLRCVCKSWYKSIPTIAKSVLGPPKIVLSSYLFPGIFPRIQTVDLEDDLADDKKRERKVLRVPLALSGSSWVIGSSNGLLCVVFWNMKDALLLWNPLINEYKIVRLPENQTLDFSQELLGFGYDPCSDDFKVVRFLQLYKSNKRRRRLVLVYSLKTDSWRHLETESSRFDKICDSEPEFTNRGYISECRIGTLANGALYWPTGKERRGDIYENEQILRFHLGDEKLSLVKTPYVLNNSFGLMAFQRDKLCVYEKVRDEKILMWVLKEDPKTELEEPKWTELMNIPIAQRLKPCSTNYLTPLCFGRNGEVLLCTVPCNIIGRCRLYIPGCSFLPNLMNTDLEGWFYGKLVYQESVQSLVAYGGKRTEKRAINPIK